jgi:hypothetical protein
MVTFKKILLKLLDLLKEDLTIIIIICLWIISIVKTIHKLYIKGEVIASSGIWIAKKRYAMLKTYDLEKDMAIEPKLGVKGLDIIRSTFPQYFKTYMRSFIIDVLKGLDKDQIDDDFMGFYDRMKEAKPTEVARNTAVKNISKYDNKDGTYKKGCPMHVKSAINYNNLLQRMGIGIQRLRRPTTNYGLFGRIL